MSRLVSSLLCGLGAVAWCSPATADWTAVHRDGSGNAAVPVASLVTDVSVAPAWSTGAGSLNTGARALDFEGRVYAVEFASGPAAIRIKGFNRQTGVLEWTSADLDVGDSIAFGSLSAPVIDPATRALFHGSGSSMHRLDLDAATPAASLVWSTAISASNTDANGETQIINSSAALGAGNVYVKTFKGFLSPKSSQVVAFDAGTGAVAWHAMPAGPGQATPLFVDLGASKLVLVDAADGSGNGGLVAYDALTGAEVWNHATLTTPWNTGGRQFYGDLALHGGSVYAFTYDFSASGNLVIVDPATGAAAIHASLGTDCAPVIVGSTVYGIGGAYGDADIRAYNAATGAQLFSADLFGGLQYIFRNYLAATNDSLYVATDNGFGFAPNTFLLRLDPSTGATLSASVAVSNYTGAVTVGDDGAVFAFRQDGSLNALGITGASSVSDWGVLGW
jgi:hypothetical protein